MAEASAGDLDPAFGKGGLTTTHFDVLAGAGFQSAQARGEIAGAFSNGTLVVSGNALFGYGCGRIGCTGFTGARFLSAYRPDGSLDPSFGAGGVTATNGLDSRVARVVGGGRVVSVGLSDLQTKVDARALDTSGAAVPSYGNGGTASIDLPPSIYHGIDLEMAASADGSVVVGVVGSEDAYDTKTHLLLTRILPNGTQDMTFGTGGWEQTELVPFQRLSQVAVDSHGAITTLEQAFSTMVVRRFTPEGSPDLNFGNAGTLAIGQDDGVSPELAVGADGDFYVARKDPQGVEFSHYRADGSPDPTYGAEGSTAPTDEVGLTAALALDASGGLLVQSGATTLGRYLPDGTLDRSFGSDGWARVFTHDASGPSDIELIGNSLAVAYGHSQTADVTVGRYRLDPSPPDDIDADGVVDRKDACPGVYRPKSGCPTIRGALSLTSKGGKLRGSAVSRDSSCVPIGQKVRLLRVTHGERHRFGITRLRRGSNGRRTFAFPEQDAGRYLASIRKRTIRTVGSCSFRASKAVRLR